MCEAPKHDNTKQIETEKEFYKNIANSGSALIWCANTEKKCTYFNEVWLRFRGRSMEEEYGDGWAEGVHPDDLDACINDYSEYFDKRATFTLLYRLRRYDGVYRWIKDQGSPQYNEKGEFTGYFGFCLDVTDLIETKEKMNENDELFKAAFDISQDGICISKVSDGKYVKVNKQFTELCGYSENEILGKSGLELQFWICDNERVNYLNNVSENKHVNDVEINVRISTGEIKTCLVSGTLIQYKGEAHIISYVKDITEKKLIEDAEKSAEKKFKSMIEHAPDGIILIDIEGNFKYISPNTYRMLEYPLETDISKLRPEKETHPDDLPMVLEHLQKVIYNPEYIPTIQYRFRTNTGYAWIESTFTNLLHEPSINGIVINFRDITHSKKIQDELKENELLLRTIIETAPFEIWARDKEGIGILENKVLVNHFGSILNKKPEYSEISDEIKHLWLENNRRVFAGESLNEECGYTINGKEKIFRQINAPIFRDGDIQGIVGFNIDITDWKIAEKTAENRYELINLTGSMAHVGAWEFDIETLEGQWTDEVARIHEMDVNEKTNANIGLDFYQGESRKKIEEAIDFLIKTGTPYDLELDLITKKGNHKWIRTIGHPIYKDGKISSLRGTFQDITQSKNNEIKYKDENKFFRTLLETIPDLVWLVDKDGKYLFCNPGFEKMFGKAESEIIGKINYDFMPKDIANHSDKTTKEVLNEKPYLNFESEIPNASGELRVLETIKTKMFDSSGNLIGILGIARDITEFKKFQNNLKNREEIYSTIVNQANDSIALIDVETGIFIEYNDECCNGLGYTREEFINKSVMDIDAILSKDEVFDHIQYMLKNKSSVFESVLQKKDGSLMDVRASLKIIEISGKTFIATIWSDITKKKKDETQIRKLSEAIEQSPVSIVITDTKGNIEYVNKKFCQSIGYSIEELLGKVPRALKKGQSSDLELEKLLDAITHGKGWSGELLNRTKEGGYFWENAVISPIKNSENKVTNLLIVSEDISWRKEMENNLIAAKEKAEESDRLKTAFLHNMSHEIRTPLNAIVGFSEFLSEPDLHDGKRDEFIEIIQQSSNQLLSIITDIINISTIQAGQSIPHEKETDIKILIQNIYNQLSLKVPEGIDFSYELQLEQDTIVMLTDNTKLSQIITNLVVNALKFTERGFVKFGCKLQNSDLLFFVSDSGIGIEKELHEKIFERFRQGELTMSRKYGGNGLGLSIAKSYIELLGGKIWLESEPGIGTIFYFTIPLKLSKSDSLFSNIKNKNAGSTKTILIVDDEDSNFMLYQIYLSSFHFKIIQAKNGAEAVRIVEQNQNIDLALMDIKMPVMDGYTAATKIKELNSEIKIIAQTSYALSGDREKALNNNCDDYLAKPVSKDELINLVKKHLNL